MITKKAQSQIITTILIILLVLAAIVIVWQVVRTTVEEGAEEVETQSSCLGVEMRVTKTDDTNFVVRREAGGKTFTSSLIVIIKDGESVDSGYNGINDNDFNSPLTSKTLTFTSGAPTKSVEVGLKVGDTVCPNTGKWTA